MIVCRECGANCDPGDIQQGLCEDCRSPEQEIHILPKNIDGRRQREKENIERNGARWEPLFIN